MPNMGLPYQIPMMNPKISYNPYFSPGIFPKQYPYPATYQASTFKPSNPFKK